MDDSVSKLQYLQLVQQVFSGPMDPAMEDAETTDDDFTARPDSSQLSRLLAAITHPNAMVNGGFVHWFPPSETGAAPSPTSSLLVLFLLYSLSPIFFFLLCSPLSCTAQRQPVFFRIVIKDRGVVPSLAR